MQKDFTSLLSKEMDRRGFLQHIAIGVVALTGMSTLLKAMNDLTPQRRTVGYGTSAYGGAKLSHKS
jgi:hypothetical protein